MLHKSIIYGGFDLSFIDIDILPFKKDDKLLINELPPLGFHHTNTKISFKPGGNGFNLCRTLGTLGREVTYVGPTSLLFEELIKKNMIPVNIYPIQNTAPNITAVLNMHDGEIQFNSSEQFLSFQHLSEDLLKKFSSSRLKSISNVALNRYSIEWINSLLLSLILENSFEFIKLNPNVLDIKKEFCKTDFDGILFIDPSDLSNFSRITEFFVFLKDLKLFHGTKFLSINEHEIGVISHILNKSPNELYDYLGLPIILHTPDFVRYLGKETTELDTISIKNPLTFVGAGDCFNGTFIHSILDSNAIHDSLKSAVNAATHLIKTGNYPSNVDPNNR